LGGISVYDGAAIAAAELSFREGIWSAAPHDAVDELEIRKQWFGPILATVCAGLADAPEMNMLQGAAEPAAVAGGHLADAVEWMRSWEVDYLVPVASDRPESEAAEAWLAEHGYEQGHTLQRFARAVGGDGADPEAAVDVRRLTSRGTEGMSLIFADALGLSHLATVPLLDLPEVDGWSCYSAYLDGREVACGSMLLAGGVAMLGLDATAEDARRRGCHTALIRRRLHDAAGAGCETAVAEACDLPGQRSAAACNLRRQGFVAAGRSVAWHRPLRK
jgi:hypothetical protein